MAMFSFVPKTPGRPSFSVISEKITFGLVLLWLFVCLTGDGLTHSSPKSRDESHSHLISRES